MLGAAVRDMSNSRAQEIETHEIKNNGNFALADHGIQIKKKCQTTLDEVGSCALAEHGVEIKKRGSFTLADHESVANQHAGEADKASKHAKRSVHVVRFEQSVDVVIVGVGCSGAHVQEQEREQEHRRIDNDKTAATTTTTQRQRQLPQRQRRRACRSACVLEMEKGIIPGDLESIHARDAQGSATPVAESGGGQVGALAGGVRPAKEKGAISGGLINSSVRNGSQVLTPERLGNGQCD